MKDDEIKALKAGIEKKKARAYEILWKDAMLIASENADLIRDGKRNAARLNRERAAAKREIVEGYINDQYQDLVAGLLKDRTPSAAKIKARDMLAGIIKKEAEITVTDDYIRRIIKKVSL